MASNNHEKPGKKEGQMMADESNLDRLDLMDLFRRDMTGIEPTKIHHDDNPHPSAHNNPLAFKMEESSFLFKVWCAGRESGKYK